MRAPRPTARVLRLYEQRVVRRAGSKCWGWRGPTMKFGYGAVRGLVAEYGGRRPSFGAHRLAWFIAHGKWPKLDVLHHCDNPACTKTEPDARFPDGHLFIGTQRDNVLDMVNKGRNYVFTARRGEAHPTAKLTTADVLAMRAARAAGETYQSIADRYGIQLPAAWRICQGQRWSHVGGKRSRHVYKDHQGKRKAANG